MATWIFVAAQILMLGFLDVSRCLEQPVDYTGYKVLKVDIRNVKEAQILKELKNELQVELWNNPNPVVGYSMVLSSPENHLNLKQKLHNERMKFETVFPDFQKVIEKERGEIERATAFSAAGHYAIGKPNIDSFNYAVYHKLDEIEKYLEQATGQYPHISEMKLVGKSYENRSISAIKITSAPSGTRPAVVLECGIHPREWVSTATCLYIIGQLLIGHTNSSNAEKLISQYEWYIIPAANPDGYHFTHTKDRNWRKTRSKSSIIGSCIGADANRNFDANFCGSGSSRNPCDEEYCGDHAFSENETKALRDFVKGLGSRLKIYFSLHNFSQLWMYPYAHTTEAAPNAQQLESLALIGAAALKAVHGKTYTVGQISKIIYEASGSSVDWIYDNTATKLAYALELRDRGVFGFMLPAGQILPTARETWAGIQATVEAALI